MPARIVVVTADAAYANAIARDLVALGYDSVALSDSMEAVRELEHPRRIELLIASAEFPAGKPTGISLARMGRSKRRELQVILLGPPAFEPLLRSSGLFLKSPISAGDVAAAAARLLGVPSLEADVRPPSDAVLPSSPD